MASGGPGVDPKRFGEAAKYTAAVAIIFFALYLLRKKLGDVTWEQVKSGIQSIPTLGLVSAFVLTCFNFVILTAYDWIALRYLKKEIPLSKMTIGAIVGYAFSNVFGWLFGGTAARFYLYSNWGMQIFEFVAFISVLSLTFWLGMFLLAGVAFVALPVHLPEEYADAMFVEPHVLGWIFIAVVGLYLLASMFVRRPIKWKDKQFSIPPLKMSIMQLLVSAGDFLLASMVLYVLLPHQGINFSTTLVAYLSAMIVVVTLHAPGGIGILEVVIVYMLAHENGKAESTELKVAVVSGLLIFRVIYHLLPAAVAAVLFLWQVFTIKKQGQTLRDKGSG